MDRPEGTSETLGSRLAPPIVFETKGGTRMRRTTRLLLLSGLALLLVSLALLILPGPGLVLLPLAVALAAVGGVLAVVDRRRRP